MPADVARHESWVNHTEASPTRREEQRASQFGRKRDRRVATAIATSPPSVLSLSPLLYNLPSSMTAFKGYLPQSVSKPKSIPQHVGEKLTYARWQSADIDGRGKAALLITSRNRHALRIFRQPDSRLDAEAKEDHAAAEEMVSVPKLDLDRNATILPSLVEAEVGASAERIRREIGGYKVVQADITSSGVVMLVRAEGYAVAKLDLGTGLITTWRAVPGIPTMRVSDRAIAIMVDAHTHVINTRTLETMTSTQISSPAIAISGRLLAYTTTEEPRSLGRDGHGTLIASRRRPTRRQPSVGPVSSHQSRIASTSATTAASTAAVLSSAAGYGGMAARGVLTGLKKGAQMAQAANEARLGRLAQSAPERSMMLGDEEAEGEEILDEEMQQSAEKRNMGEQPQQQRHKPIARWIKIVDYTKERIVAHFQLPHDTYGALLSPTTAGLSAVSNLSFNPDGTQLLAAQGDGRACHVFQIHPAAPGCSVERDVHGEVYHMYELKRGNTPAEIKDVVWDNHGRWIGIISGHGTLHVYPTYPSGAVACKASHLSIRLGNATNVPQLSTSIQSVARFRQDAPHGDRPASAMFSAYRCDPISGRYLQDIAIYRPDSGVVEAVRLIVGKRKQDDRFGTHHSGELAIESKVNVRWYLPDPADEVHLITSKRVPRRAIPAPLAHAEIRTYSIDPRVLPKSIYLNQQFTFHAVRAIDEHSPLSMIDLEARQKRLVYRVEVAPVSDTTDPFNNAVETAIPSPSHRPIPGLPNGQPGSWGSSLPRQVAHGVGEGLDRFKEHYAHAHARAQAARRRQAGEALSFEDAVFPSIRRGTKGEDVDDISDSELPGLLSDRGSGSASVGSNNIGTSPVESGWGDRDEFEKEYDAAVRDEEPDELILGVMDELEVDVRDVRDVRDARDVRGTEGEWGKTVYAVTPKGKGKGGKR